MNRIIPSVLVFLFAAALVRAEEPAKKTMVYAFTGLSRPNKPESFYSSWSSGYDLGVGMGYALSPKFELDGILTYNNFPFDQQSFEESLKGTENLDSTRVDGDPAHILTFMVRAKWIAPPGEGSKSSMYGFVDAGWMYRHQNGATVTPPRKQYTLLAADEHAACAGLGLGADFLLDPSTNFFVEVEAVAGFTKSETVFYLPIKFGMRIRL
jgi:hypothetical protein